MKGHAILRKRRRDEVTKKCNILFSKAIDDKDYEKAALIVFYNVLKVYGTRGIMDALDDANSFISRRDIRRGL